MPSRLDVLSNIRLAFGLSTLIYLPMARGTTHGLFVYLSNETGTVYAINASFLGFPFPYPHESQNMLAAASRDVVSACVCVCVCVCDIYR